MGLPGALEDEGRHAPHTLPTGENGAVDGSILC